MIHVPRDRVTPSEEWFHAASEERARADEYFSSREPRTPFAYRLYGSPETKNLLNSLFKGKCAFCETRYAVTQPVNSEHFRPIQRVIGLEGKIREPGYWWLGSEWTNLHSVCIDCSRNKGNRFPVVGSPARKPGEEADEAPVLLDPCVDELERYLVFNEAGFVANLPLDTRARADLGLRRYSRTDRAEVTIDVFGLNRSGLVNARRELAKRLKLEFDRCLQLANLRKGFKLEKADAEDVRKELERLLQAIFVVSEEQEFVALRRQLAGEFGRQHPELAEIRDQHVPEMPPPPVQAVEEAQKSQAFEQLQRHRVRVKKSSVGDRSDNLIYSHTATIDRVEIRNFHNIEHLEFSIPAGTPDRLGWKVLLGENAVGKSSVLQAVALTLMGARRAARLRDIKRSRVLRDGSRPPEGHVKLYLSAEADPIQMDLTREGFFFPEKGSGLRTFLVGFGAARWLPRRGSLRPETDELVRIRNLFNPFVPMNDALGWLMSLNPRRFKRAEKAVLRLFDRPEGDRLRRLRGEVFLQPEGLPKSKAFRLAELSDGYQAMLAMAGEIAEITDPAWENLSDAEGLVLVDELEAHLHPRWKMRVVDSLRRAFPRMQFLASTHDPLCLRGLDAGEILVMRRDDEGQLFAFDELPGTEKMRVDQLLTSQLFGLGSTLDPETEKRFTEYYSLLGKRSRATEEQARFEELSATIGSRGMLGSSRRDRAIYHIVDEFLARREAPPQGTWLEMDEETKRKVLDLLEMAKVPP